MSKKKKAKKGTLGESPFKVTVCSFCEHPYVFPCNGERYDCQNAVWKRSEGRIDVVLLTDEQRIKLIETGKLPNITTNTKHVTSMVQDVSTGKSEVKRVKLKDPKQNNPPKKKRRVRL